MEQKKSPEQRVRIKIGLIFFVVILYFMGLFTYSYFLKKNMDIRKSEMNNAYKVLSGSNRLIGSIQQAQDILNMYLASPRRALQQQYDSISNEISLQIINIEGLKPDKAQHLLLKKINSLLQEKNRTVRRLTGLFRSQNPMAELDEKINRYDEIIRDSVVVTTSSDTTQVEKQRKGFWSRLRDIFDPAQTPDTTINIARTEQKSWSASRVDTLVYSDLKNITEEASRSYSSHIRGIEREVRELLFAEQNISLHISQLTNEFYNKTIQMAWKGTESSEELTRRIFMFAIVVGALSILFILIIIFFIIDDLNKGEKARTDLAREKQFTEELIESRYKLLLSVSHDVKTPLSSMMGYMEMWDSEEADEDKKRQLQSARSSGKHILTMLTNLLEFSRLQQKSAKLHYSRFNLIELMEEIVRMFQPLTEEKALSLTFESPLPAPLYIETDHTLLKQALINVVSNAVKYTIEGGVAIRVEQLDQLIFTITDSGIGMDADELPEIFKPFSRMQTPLEAEGSGFGMYVTKGVVELLKGKIEVTSEKGKGTRVTITLPIRQLPAQTAQTAQTVSEPTNTHHSPKKGVQFHKILLFEDNFSLGNMIREYFTHNGYKVKLCSNPQDINGFLRVISLFDIVFTDMQMTEITGMDVLREIRKRDADIPVWLMTAHGEYTEERATSEGFTGFVTKPIQMSRLIEIVSGKYNPHPIIPEKGAVEEEGLGTGGSEEEPPKTENAKKQTPGYGGQFPQLTALFGNDTQTVREILSGFVASSHRDTEHLQELIANGAFEEAQQRCHKMYPFLCQLDASHLTTALQKMDRLRGESESAYPEWKEELTKTIAEIKRFTEMISKELLTTDGS